MSTLLAILGATATLTSGPAIRVPGFTAYGEPDADALRLDQAGIVHWSDAGQTVLWFGYLPDAGRLDCGLTLRLGVGDTSAFQLTVSPVGGDPVGMIEAEVTGAGADSEAPLGSVAIAAPGYHRFALTGLRRSGAEFGDVRSLDLAGPAARGAHFNLERRRNCASVHLGYPLPQDTPVEWFYSEVTPRTDPLYTYYEVCGWHRGYFGIQVNSPTERRIIFSVWDSGDEAVDRENVQPEDRVQLVAKGEDVYAGGFGNEGTGGHSHLVYPWMQDQTYRLLLHAEPDGGQTTYSGWFWFPERGAWGLIASFRAPKDGGWPRGLYAFNENFGGSNGHLRRLCEFGNQWVRLANGAWLELTTARFTHDPTGREARHDYAAGVVDGRFFLSNGGFIGQPIALGDTFSRPATATPPALDLPTRP